MSISFEGGGGVDLDSLVEVAFAILLAPNEMVFWLPFAAGPPEVRDRRVGGILRVV